MDVLVNNASHDRKSIRYLSERKNPSECWLMVKMEGKEETWEGIVKKRGQGPLLRFLRKQTQKLLK